MSTQSSFPSYPIYLKLSTWDSEGYNYFLAADCNNLPESSRCENSRYNCFQYTTGNGYLIPNTISIRSQTKDIPSSMKDYIYHNDLSYINSLVIFQNGNDYEFYTIYSSDKADNFDWNMLLITANLPSSGTLYMIEKDFVTLSRSYHQIPNLYETDPISSYPPNKPDIVTHSSIVSFPIPKLPNETDYTNEYSIDNFFVNVPIEITNSELCPILSVSDPNTILQTNGIGGVTSDGVIINNVNCSYPTSFFNGPIQQNLGDYTALKQSFGDDLSFFENLVPAIASSQYCTNNPSNEVCQETSQYYDKTTNKNICTEVYTSGCPQPGNGLTISNCLGFSKNPACKNYEYAKDLSVKICSSQTSGNYTDDCVNFNNQVLTDKVTISSNQHCWFKPSQDSAYIGGGSFDTSNCPGGDCQKVKADLISEGVSENYINCVLPNKSTAPPTPDVQNVIENERIQKYGWIPILILVIILIIIIVALCIS